MHSRLDRKKHAKKEVKKARYLGRTASDRASRSRGGGYGGRINPSPLGLRGGLVELINELARGLHALRLSASADYDYHDYSVF